jgi:hypothetical protein
MLGEGWNVKKNYFWKIGLRKLMISVHQGALIQMNKIYKKNWLFTNENFFFFYFYEILLQ